MLQTMKRIQVIGPKPAFNRVVDLLYQQGTLHLEDVSQSVSPDEIPLHKVVLDTAARVTEGLGKINGIFSTLPLVTADPVRQRELSTAIRKLSHEQVLLRAEDIIKKLEATTRNPYGYTGGNPLQFVDPLGLDWIQDCRGELARRLS